jgi:pimeloyl-ACP methyl ester carboxylesterase
MVEIRSEDGTPIAYQRDGSGAPLVLAHGTGGSSARWGGILPALLQHFTVYTMDRRGRGMSGDSDTYSIEREFADVAAVVDSIGEPVYLLGHSYGAICSLQAALLTDNIRKLVLYEPPITIAGQQLYPPENIEPLEGLLVAGDREGVLAAFMMEINRMPAEQFALMRSLPSWPARVAAVHTLPRELRAQQAYQFEAARFMNMTTPTLLLLGGDSPPFYKTAVEAVHAALPDSRIVVLPGQQHIAMDTAPELFVREVVGFLTA